MEDIVNEQFEIVDVEEKLDFEWCCPFNFICPIT